MQGITVLDAGPQRLCPRCSTGNDDDLRFCRKCGFSLWRPPTASLASTAQRPARWWHRWFPIGGEAKKEAGAAYRRSLPMRYRVRRVAAGVLVAALAAAGWTAIHSNPAGWIRDRWADWQNSLVQIADVQAVTEPADAALPDFPAAATVDNVADTAWATAWTTSTPPASCQAPAVTPAAGSTGSLLLLLNHPVTVRAISVAAGLANGDSRRLHQWRPKTLQLSFSDGQCQQVTLTDTAPLQQLDLNPTATADVRVSVVDTFAASPDQPSDLVALSEVRLFAAPRRHDAGPGRNATHPPGQSPWCVQ